MPIEEIIASLGITSPVVIVILLVGRVAFKAYMEKRKQDKLLSNSNLESSLPILIKSLADIEATLDKLETKHAEDTVTTKMLLENTRSLETQLLLLAELIKLKENE